MARTLDHLTNPFYSPFSGTVLIKGVEDNGQWIVYLQASNEFEDQDGETMDMRALEKAANYYLTHGVLSWDHKHKQTHDPGFIIGEPLDVKFNNAKETLVKGFLYKFNDIAKNVWKNIKSGAEKLGASVGGGILQKASSAIKEVIWDETAITHKPVNDLTFGNVQMVPFTEFAKALTAGGGVDAGSFTGGRALTPESLQGTPNKEMAEDIRRMIGSLLKSLRSGKVQSYNDLVDFVYDHGYEGNNAVTLITYLARKMTDVVGRGGL